MKGLEGINESTAICIPDAFPSPVHVYFVVLEGGPLSPEGHSSHAVS